MTEFELKLQIPADRLQLLIAAIRQGDPAHQRLFKWLIRISTLTHSMPLKVGASIPLLTVR
jgi:hypothetical protein